MKTTDFVEKKVYQAPMSSVIEIASENFIATSGTENVEEEEEQDW